jgi:hypothetical protein
VVLLPALTVPLALDEIVGLALSANLPPDIAPERLDGYSAI